MADTSVKTSGKGGSKLGLAILLFTLILGGLAFTYQWVRPFALRNGASIEIGLRIDPQRMLRDLKIR